MLSGEGRSGQEVDKVRGLGRSKGEGSQGWGERDGLAGESKWSGNLQSR